MLTVNRAFPPMAGNPGSTVDRQYFAETRHSVSYDFLACYRRHGGPDFLGNSISEEIQENGLLVLYFRRARLEHRPEPKGTPYEISLGRLGHEYLQKAGN